MNTIVLNLQGLACQHCVKNVQGMLSALDKVEHAEVSLDFAKITGEIEPAELIERINGLGYQAQLAQANFRLDLQGLACGHCVKNVERALTELQRAVGNLRVFVVRKTDAEIYGDIEPQQVIEVIEKAGYQASLQGHFSPKAELLSELTFQQNSPDPEIVAQSADQVMLLLSGLSCSACVAKVEKALQQVPLVNAVQINLAESTALIEGYADPDALILAVEQAGYGAELLQDDHLQGEKQQAQLAQEISQRQRQSLLALVVGCGLMAWGLLGSEMHLTSDSRVAWLFVGLLSLAVMIYSGKHFYQNAWRNLRNRTATMDTLVALGTGVAWLSSMLICLVPNWFPENARHLYFEASIMILGFINLGKWLEAKAKRQSSMALQCLLNLTPTMALQVDEQGEREIPLQQVKQGMRLRLKTGDLVPVDGLVVQGTAWLDEAMLTGEPLPVMKQYNDEISAGTLVTDGSIIFVAEQIGQRTRLAQIIKLVRQAQSSKPRMAQLADKIAGVFVPVIMVIALLAAVVWAFIDVSYSLTVLTSVLVIACPCALGLATPMSIIASVGRAAELGILVRNAESLQQAADVDTLVFDKTGTLTLGQPKVTDIFCVDDVSEQQLIAYAAKLEQGANHPLAKAILDLAEQKSAVDFQAVFADELTQFQTLQGLGVQGQCNSQNLLLGNRTLLQQQGIDLRLAEDFMQQQTVQGATVVLLALNQRLIGAFAICDLLRTETADVMNKLLADGYQLIMLTGDQQKTAQYMAQQATIPTVIAEVLPAQKAEKIKALQANGHRVLMIGDGINDAPALAQADVSIAMGAGSDIAIETAGLTLMGNNLHRLVDALALAKATVRNMKQNLFAAFIYNVLAIPVAAGLLYPFGIMLNPMWAGAAMALSSVTVVLNANRLLAFKPH